MVNTNTEYILVCRRSTLKLLALSEIDTSKCVLETMYILFIVCVYIMLCEMYEIGLTFMA